MHGRNEKRGIGTLCGLLACGTVAGLQAAGDIHTGPRGWDDVASSWLAGTALGKGPVVDMPESTANGQAPNRGQNTVGNLAVDFDGDGDVDQADYGLLQLHLGEPAMPYCRYDLDGSGMVDGGDVLVFEKWERRAK